MERFQLSKAPCLIIFNFQDVIIKDSRRGWSGGAAPLLGYQPLEHSNGRFAPCWLCKSMP